MVFCPHDKCSSYRIQFTFIFQWVPKGSNATWILQCENKEEKPHTLHKLKLTLPHFFRVARFRSHQTTVHLVCNAHFLWSNHFPEVLMCFKALYRVQREHESWTIFHWQNHFILLVACWVILPIMTRHLIKPVYSELDLDDYWFF